jgi:hypothetical protein
MRFHKADVLNEQLGQSEVSGKSYRLDQESASAVSGKRGHLKEFVRCHETKRILLPGEAERCAKTGKIVAPDVLQPCAVTGKRVLPGELRTSSVSGKRVLPEHLVTSNISNAVFLEEEGVRSAYGKFCAPVEAKRCQWSGAATHPDDIRTCALLGLAVHFQYIAESSGHLQPAEELLAGTRRTADAREHWDRSTHIWWSFLIQKDAESRLRNCHPITANLPWQRRSNPCSDYERSMQECFTL